MEDIVRREPEETQGDPAQPHPPGFWRRMFGGGAGEPVASPSEPAAGTGAELDLAQPAPHNRPRKPSRSGKPDKAEQERFSRAAMIRRERLARAIGERVEEVIEARMETGEEKLARVSQGFQEVRVLLGAIGRNLDASAERSERIARALLTLPETGARGQELLERVLEVLRTLPEQGDRGRELLARIGEAIDGHAQEEQSLLTRIASALDDQTSQGQTEQAVLARIEDVLEGQSTSTRTLAEQVQGGVPQVLALARQSQDAARERLLALREVKAELELQRDQRERLIEAVRESGERCQERLGKLEEALAVATVQSRQDAGALRGALQGVGDRLVAQGKEESRREEERGGRLEEGLLRLARQLGEGNAVAASAAASHDRAVERFRDAHAELIETFQRTQHRTLSEMQRIQEEVSERADQLARRTRRTLVACAGALAIAVAAGVGLVRSGGPTPQRASRAEPGAVSGATVLPASVQREGR